MLIFFSQAGDDDAQDQSCDLGMKPDSCTWIAEVVLDVEPEISLDQRIKEPVVEEDDDGGRVGHLDLSGQDTRLPRAPSASAIRSIWRT